MKAARWDSLTARTFSKRSDKQGLHSRGSNCRSSSFDPNVHTIDDLRAGMLCRHDEHHGVLGAFVDIGVSRTAGDTANWPTGMSHRPRMWCIWASNVEVGR